MSYHNKLFVNENCYEFHEKFLLIDVNPNGDKNNNSNVVGETWLLEQQDEVSTVKLPREKDNNIIRKMNEINKVEQDEI